MHKIISYGTLFVFIIIIDILYGIGQFKPDSFAIGLALAGGLTMLLPLLFDELSKNRDKKKIRQVCKIGERVNDKGLDNDIQGKLNEIQKNNMVVDSIQILESTGFIDHRKEVYITYH